MKKSLVTWLILVSAGIQAGEFIRIENPGFDAIEDGVAKGWSKAGPAWRAERGAGLNGSGALVYDSAAAQHAPRPSQRVELKTGRKYKISASVIADGLKVDRPGSPAQGMTVMLSWFDANGKWLGEAVATGAAKGKTDEWTRASAITPDMPEKAARFVIEPYVCGWGVGKGRIDNIVIETVDQNPVEVVTSSAYRNESTGGKVRFAATVNWSDSIPESDQKAYFVYKSADGRLVKVEAEKVACGVTAEIDTGLFAYGTNDVLCVIRAGGKTYGSGKMPFAHLKELPHRRVRIDAKQRLIVDGKPFFPLGMYCGGMTDEKIAHYARSPFNCIGPYPNWSKEQLDLLDSYGLKVIYSLCHAPSREASYVPNLCRNVKTFAADHPAVIGWYICDEPTLGMLPDIVTWRRRIEEMDGGHHPIWGVLCVFNDTRHVLDAFDVLGIDPYPVPGPVSKVTAAIRTSTDGMFGTKAMWNVPQAFGWGWLGRRENKGQRAPNKVEMANMTWQMIAGGANGIVYYSYSQMKDIYEDIDDRIDCYWMKVCAAAAEVRAYERVLLADGDAPSVVSSSCDLVCRSWRDGEGRTYVLTVNITDRPLKAQVTLGEPFAKAEMSEFGPAPILEGDRLSYDLPALGYVMVRLVK